MALPPMKTFRNGDWLKGFEAPRAASGRNDANARMLAGTFENLLLRDPYTDLAAGMRADRRTGDHALCRALLGDADQRRRRVSDVPRTCQNRREWTQSSHGLGGFVERQFWNILSVNLKPECRDDGRPERNIGGKGLPEFFGSGIKDRLKTRLDQHLLVSRVRQSLASGLCNLLDDRHPVSQQVQAIQVSQSRSSPASLLRQRWEARVLR